MKTTTNKKKIFLLSIFLICVIPTIYVYIDHALVEKKAYDNAKTETKKIKTLGESALFMAIGVGYLVLTLLIVVIEPNSRVPYIVLIVGTVAVVILYYMRIFGIPIPGTEIVITDLSTDWRDVVTKICQQIMLIPISMLLILNRKEQKDQLNTF